MPPLIEGCIETWIRLSGSCGFEATYGLLLLPAKRLKGTVPYHGFFYLSNRNIFPMPFLFLKNFSSCHFLITLLFLKTYPLFSRSYLCHILMYFTHSIIIFVELYIIILYIAFLFFRNVGFPSLLALSLTPFFYALFYYIILFFITPFYFLVTWGAKRAVEQRFEFTPTPERMSERHAPNKWADFIKTVLIMPWYVQLFAKT